MEFRNKTLANGLSIIGEVNNFAQSAAVGFFVRTGSRDETDAVSGVSHFLEHMMFKGTDKLTAMEVNEAFDRTGAQFNAFTSEENTVYYAAVLPEYVEEVTQLWAQLMRPALRDEDFDLEKNVIKEEIAMYKDLPQFDVMDRAKALHFDSHPCGRSVLGTNESIAALKSSQMREYFGVRYAPNNLVLACCGDIDFDKTCELAEAGCGGWIASQADRTLSDCNGSGKKERETIENLTHEHICLLSAAVSMQDKRRYANSLAAMIIGDCTGSRYYWALVDNALADTAAMQYESMDGAGAMYSYIRCSSENKDKVMDIVAGIFDDIQRDGVSENELRTAANKVLSAVTIKSETPMGRLVNLGFNWVYSNEYRNVDEDIAAIKAVKTTDINALIQELKLSKFTQLSIGPGK
jgi:predicted Zn-dependent peptidase